MKQDIKPVTGTGILLRALLQLVIIVAGALAVSVFVLIPLFQDKALKPIQAWELEYLNGGTLALLAAEISQLAPQKRKTYVQRQASDFGFNISLVDLASLDADLQNEIKLREYASVGNPARDSVYRVLESTNQVLVFQNTKTPAQHLVDEAQRRHMGTLSLLQRRLADKNKDALKASLVSVSQLFEYPITVSSLEEIPLNEKQKKALLAGHIVAVDTEDSDMADYPAEWVYQKIEGQSKIIALGPFSGPTLQRFYPIIAGYFVIFGLFLLIPVCVWLAPTLRSLNRLTKATNGFGRGDFTVRANSIRGSKLNFLTATFNNMAEKIQDLIESNKALINAVSHELRTPLSRIEFNIELARQSKNLIDRDQHLERIENSVDELKTMVSEMLQYARFDREKPNFNLASVNMRDWLETERENWQHDGKVISIILACSDEGISAHIECYYMSRAISNIVSNGTRFAQSKIIVSIMQTGEFIEIAVDDDGSGVAYQERAKIFEPFVRKDDSRNKDSGGIGLGLAIVKQIVDWHAGKIWVEESSLGGARFVIHLPKNECYE